MRKLFFLLAVCFFPICVFSQIDGEEFAPQDDFDAFQQQANRRFERFKDSVNLRFSKELEHQWKAFKVFAGEERPVKPKPVAPPVAPEKHPSSSTELPVDDVLFFSQPAPIPVLQDEPEPRDAMQVKMMMLAPAFFNQSIRCECPADYAGLRLENESEKAVSAFWKSLAQEGSEIFIRQCRRQISILQLNDWGVFQFAKSMARQLFPDRNNEQTVTIVFIVNQLGFNAKVGRRDDQLLCLLPVRHTLYSQSYLLLSGTKYYIFYPSATAVTENTVYSYSLDFPSAQSSFDMNICEPVNFEPAGREHVFSTQWLGRDISVSVNPSLIDFYGEYPQVELAVYANAAPDPRWAAQMKNSLLPVLEGRDEYQATAALLNFIHKSFPYVNDKEKFGQEKYFFCEENFYYKGSDCEDRAVLFSYLVRELVGLEVVLLDYPDHVATAVHFHNPSVEGDYFMFNGKKFIVCDPTYFGSSVGEPMPQYKGVKAKLIELKK